MSKPEWRPVVGYEGIYEVSEIGVRRCRPISPFIPKKGGGHPVYQLRKDGQSNSFAHLTLLREAFPEKNYPQRNPRKASSQVDLRTAGFIRSAALTRNVSYATLARENGISASTVARIVNCEGRFKELMTNG